MVQTKHQLAKKCRKIGTCARAGDLTSKIHAVLDTNGLPVHLASRPVKRMTIGCVRFCSTRCSHKQCCSRIVDTTQTGSGSLPDSRELGRTFRRNEIGRTQSALVLYLYRARNLIEPFFNKISNVGVLRLDMTSSQPTIWRSSDSRQSEFGCVLMSPRPGFAKPEFIRKSKNRIYSPTSTTILPEFIPGSIAAWACSIVSRLK